MQESTRMKEQSQQTRQRRVRYAGVILAVEITASTLNLFAAVAHPKQFATFLSNHCFDCHDSDSAKGDFDLTALPYALDTPHHFEQWQQVFERVANGEMPPKKKKQPPAKEREPFLSALEGALTEADRKRHTPAKAQKVRPGHDRQRGQNDLQAAKS